MNYYESSFHHFFLFVFYFKLSRTEFGYEYLKNPAIFNFFFFNLMTSYRSLKFYNVNIFFSTNLNKILLYSEITIFFINNTENIYFRNYRYSKLSTAFPLYLKKRNKIGRESVASIPSRDPLISK